MSLDRLAELGSEGALEGLILPSARDAEVLKGHASRRRFVRLRPELGPDRILIVYPEEEASDGIPRYLAVTDWLRAAGVRVPAVDGRGARALLVEDAGDLRLDHGSVGGRARSRAYRQALDAIVRIQRHGRRVAAPNADWALDSTRLLRELHHFEKQTMQGWLEVSDGADRREAFYARLVEAVASIPTAQCHRDYHSRNLMLAGGRLVLVDFQDQMEGPCLYDLVSLVQDDYRDLDRATRTDLIHGWWVATQPTLTLRADARLPDAPAGLPPVARQAFCLVALQRNLKALGTFGYLVGEAGRGEYAAFAPRTWAYARRNLALLGWSDVRELTVPLERAFG